MADLKQRLAPLEGVDMPDRWNEIRRRAPRTGFDPEPPRRQPVAVVALAVVLTVVTVGWLATAFGDADDDRVAGGGWTTTALASAGLSVDHPAAWTVVASDAPVVNGGEMGIGLSSRPIEWQHPDLGPSRATDSWDMRQLPDDAVAVWIGVAEAGPGDARSLPQLPLAFADLRPIDEGFSGGATGLRADVSRLGRTVRVEVWLGASTTPEDRITIDRLVDSIRPSTPEAFPTVSPTPVATDPSPTLDPDAVDLGLGFGICDADSVTGAFGTGESTRVWFGTRTSEEMLRCSSSSRRFALAVDIGGDRNAEAWIDPIGPHLCFNGCGLVGVVDLDGDGTDELVILLEGGVTPSFGVVDVGRDGGLQVVGYADGDAPQGLPATGPARLTIGGDEAYSYGVWCEVDAGGPLITQRAIAGVVEAPELGARVATYSLRLTPDGFVVVSDEVQEGVVPPPSLPLQSSLCGLELPALGMP
jgi:hypothetical protein